MAWDEAYLRTKWHFDPSSRLATSDMGQKLGAEPPGVELGLHLTQCCPGRNLLSCQEASCPIRPFSHNKHGRKSERQCPFLGGGTGSPSNTMSPGPRSAIVPSGILIHPAVWPQQIWTENGGCVLFEELIPHLAQCRLGRGLPPYLVAS